MSFGLSVHFDCYNAQCAMRNSGGITLVHLAKFRRNHWPEYNYDPLLPYRVTTQGISQRMLLQQRKNMHRFIIKKVCIRAINAYQQTTMPLFRVFSILDKKSILQSHNVFSIKLPGIPHHSQFFRFRRILLLIIHHYS